jgi:hypothetical protein
MSSLKKVRPLKKHRSKRANHGRKPAKGAPHSQFKLG